MLRLVTIHLILYKLSFIKYFSSVLQHHTLVSFPASQCSPLPESPHANVTVLNGGGRSYGTIVRYECEPGYVRSGHPVILCMSNGTWSGDVPTCSSK